MHIQAILKPKQDTSRETLLMHVEVPTLSTRSCVIQFCARVLCLFIFDLKFKG